MTSIESHRIACTQKFKLSMTPAIELLGKLGTPHTIHHYEHDSNTRSYGYEAVKALAVDASRVFKTIVLQDKSAGFDKPQLFVAAVPVAATVNLKKASSFFNCKKVSTASEKNIIRSTGYLLGGVSPLAQKVSLATVIDQSALEHESIFLSAGKRGLEIELEAKFLTQLCNAEFSSIARFDQD